MSKLVFAIALFCLIVSSSVSAQFRRVAALEIRQAGVQITRQNSTNSVTLEQGSYLPIVDGDSIQTHEGWGVLTFPETITIVILPHTTIGIQHYSVDSGITHIELMVDGHIIQSTHRPSHEFEYQLNTATFTITKPSELFAVWSDYKFLTGITNDLGILNVLNDNHEIILQPRTAFLDGVPRVLLSSSPNHLSKLYAQNINCSLSVISDTNWNIRKDTILSANPIGFISNDNREVAIVGQTEEQDWFRIQRFTDFGWVSSDAFDFHNAGCPDLPTFTNEITEIVLTIRNWQANDLEIFLPFYDTSENNPWFYSS